MGEAGEGSVSIHELLENSVQVRCVGCGITLLPGELESLGPAGGPTASSPRLDRLRMGYCARNGCDSRFYAVSAETGMVSWPPIFRRAKELVSEGAPSELPDATSGPTDDSHAFRRKWRRTQLAVVGGAVLLGVFVWWRSGAWRPWRWTPKSESIVAPAGAGGATNANVNLRTH